MCNRAHESGSAKRQKEASWSIQTGYIRSHVLGTMVWRHASGSGADAEVKISNKIACEIRLNKQRTGAA